MRLLTLPPRASRTHAVPAHKPDPRGLVMAMNGLGISCPARCVYVGDSTGDMEAANAAGMRAVGVGWGNKTAAELEGAGASAIATTAQELIDLLLPS
eukprot:SAG22_NODE_75_length_22256_cov_45.062960_9_plen_97_part_00